MIFDHNQLATQWAGIVKAVNREPRAARFELEDNRAVRFETPQTGRTLDLVASQERLQQTLTTLGQESATVKKVAVPLVVSVTEPPLSSLAAEYGLRELIGVGKTSFAGSPVNRRHNIKIGAAKLNGLLIAPGETFSALAALRPFTLAGGYRAELVIKGNRTVPEVGGGLCQIATTLFRMAMNSAMEITNRRNHALVVNHYNDPVNGNPGTDATVYDPAPDFKFLNDTNNYILIQTEMDRKRQELIFTIWGASDGRRGSYTHPIVHKWYPFGESKTVESDTLKPGEKKCQNAFYGADASFVYTRVMPDGKEEKITYASHYRPLPRICMQGKDPNAVSSSTPATGDLPVSGEATATE